MASQGETTKLGKYEKERRRGGIRIFLRGSLEEGITDMNECKQGRKGICPTGD